MSDRERLIEILSQNIRKNRGESEIVAIANHLLTNGVIVSPCKVGDTVYFVNRFFANDPRINECTVDALHITSGKNQLGHKKPSHALVRNKTMHSLSSRIPFEDFGITAFLALEEAEKALAERSEANV